MAAGDDGTSNADDPATTLADILNGAGQVIGQGASQTILDNANVNVPGLAYTAGQNATQGALDTVTPYLPLALVAVVVLVLLSGR